jgi:hypothetical protein
MLWAPYNVTRDSQTSEILQLQVGEERATWILANYKSIPTLAAESPPWPLKASNTASATQGEERATWYSLKVALPTRAAHGLIWPPKIGCLHHHAHRSPMLSIGYGFKPNLNRFAKIRSARTLNINVSMGFAGLRHRNYGACTVVVVLALLSAH